MQFDHFSQDAEATGKRRQVASVGLLACATVMLVLQVHAVLALLLPPHPPVIADDITATRLVAGIRSVGKMFSSQQTSSVVREGMRDPFTGERFTTAVATLEKDSATSAPTPTPKRSKRKAYASPRLRVNAVFAGQGETSAMVTWRGKLIRVTAGQRVAGFTVAEIVPEGVYMLKRGRKYFFSLSKK